MLLVWQQILNAASEDGAIVVELDLVAFLVADNAAGSSSNVASVCAISVLSRLSIRASIASSSEGTLCVALVCSLSPCALSLHLSDCSRASSCASPVRCVVDTLGSSASLLSLS